MATKNKTQASAFTDLTEEQAVALAGPLFTEDQKSSGILACVSLAQFILESGYGKSELCRKANNAFGMKVSLSGNTWPGSTWNEGKEYLKQTQEQQEDGTEYTITAHFRKYDCIEDSIADHSAYLLGAMNGDSKRYAGLDTETDYKKAAQIIKDGGYATDVNYVDKLCNIIEKWNLTQYNAAEDETEYPETITKGYYRVRSVWTDSAGQLGAFRKLSNAKKLVDENPGYHVFSNERRRIYPNDKADAGEDSGETEGDDNTGTEEGSESEEGKEQGGSDGGDSGSESGSDGSESGSDDGKESGEIQGGDSGAESGGNTGSESGSSNTGSESENNPGKSESGSSGSGSSSEESGTGEDSGTGADSGDGETTGDDTTSGGSGNSGESTGGEEGIDGDGKGDDIALFARLKMLMNIRTAPSLDSDIITTYKKGTIVEVVEVCDGEWYRIICAESETGYAYMSNEAGQYAYTGTSLYTVKAGDTLWSIASEKLGDPTRNTEIKTINGLSATRVNVGMVLLIP